MKGYKNRNMKITSEKEPTDQPTDRLTLLEVLSGEANNECNGIVSCTVIQKDTSEAGP